VVRRDFSLAGSRQFGEHCFFQAARRLVIFLVHCAWRELFVQSLQWITLIPVLARR